MKSVEIDSVAASPLVLAEILEQLKSVEADIYVRHRDWDLDFSKLVDKAPNKSLAVNMPISDSRSVIEQAMADLQLDSGPISARIVDDIEQMCGLFGGLFQRDRVELRLDVTNEQSCPKFHCDNVFVRMLVTYAGPGTEYLDIRNREKIFQAPLGSLVFLKGHKHPTYQDRMLHRSPMIPRRNKRFSITINFEDWLESILAQNHAALQQ